jgi:hypothetical protein
MTDHLSRRLTILHAELRARALKAPGDGALQEILSEEYFRQAMALLGTVYGAECAAVVRERAAVARRRRVFERVATALRSYLHAWHRELPADGRA